MPRREDRRPVAADDAGEEVLVRETVVRAAEEGDELALVLVRVRERRLRRRAGAEIVDTEFIGDEALGLRAEALVVEVRVLVTTHDLELTPAEVRRVRQQLLEVLVVERELRLVRYTAGARGDRARARVEGLPNRVVDVDAHRRLGGEIRQQLQGSRGVSEDSIFRRVVVDLVNQGDGIAHVGLATDLVIRTRARLDGQRRVVDQNVREETAREARAVLQG